MNPNQPDIDKYLAILTENPRRIVTCTAGAGEATLRQQPGQRQWSIVEILAHIRACQELWSFSIYAMLSETQPSLPLLDERRWAKVTRYATLPFNDSFQAFLLRRIELTNVLRNLSFEDWARSADIGGRSHTIFSQVRRMAFHELEHVEEIEILLGYKNE